MSEQPIGKIILTTVGIFLAFAVVAMVGIFLYNTFGTLLVVLWGVLVLFLVLGYTGVIGSVLAKIKGTK